MANSSKKSFNHTGIAIDPDNVKEMMDACHHYPPDIKGSEKQLEKERVLLHTQSSSIGSMPPSATLKGMVKNSINQLVGNHPQLFLDKLGERLAYERSGIRLYEAAIAKALGDKDSKKNIQSLLHIKKEEMEHMELVKSTMEQLGADPTAITPCADLVGVMGQGFIQILTDPRTEMPQVFNTLLNLELIDNAAWELLIQLANAYDHEDLSVKFEKAFIQEEEHVAIVKSLLHSYLDLEEPQEIQIGTGKSRQGFSKKAGVKALGNSSKSKH